MITEFVKWVLIANIIALPVGLYGIRKWLESYPYRIEITLTLFAYSGLVTLFIAIVTVSYQAIKAARANPVEALKYE